MVRTFGFRRAGETPIVLGHRGASALLPENSLESFQRALSDGADGVELDVQRCRTGEVVVCHDIDLVRLAGRDGRVSELPWDELRDLKLLSGVYLPTLEQALDACGPSALVNVELKTASVRPTSVERMVDAVARIIERFGVSRRILVSSFNPMALWIWRHRAPAIRSALLIEPPVRTGWTLPFLGASAVNPDLGICTEAAIAAWHERGYAVNAWTVDDVEALRSLCEMGVDGIITNDPARTRKVVG